MVVYGNHPLDCLTMVQQVLCPMCVCVGVRRMLYLVCVEHVKTGVSMCVCVHSVEHGGSMFSIRDQIDTPLMPAV